MKTGWLVVHCLHPLDGGLAGALGAVLALLCLRPPAGVRPVPVRHRWVGHCFVTVNRGVWQSARPAAPPCPPPPPRRPPGQSAQSPPALVATAPPCRTPVCTGPVSPRSGPPRSSVTHRTCYRWSPASRCRTVLTASSAAAAGTPSMSAGRGSGTSPRPPPATAPPSTQRKGSSSVSRH